MKNKKKTGKPAQERSHHEFSPTIENGRIGLWVALGIVLLLALVIFHKFLSGSSYYFFKDIGSDTLNGHYPNFACAIDYMKNEGFPSWSFQQGMGQNIMWPTFMDPFFGIVYAAGANHIGAAVIWMELVKILLTALLVYQLLNLNRFSFTARVLGTLLYCYSGFMIVGGSWYQFSTEACFLAFLLFSFEKLYRQDSWYLFPFAVALIPIFQPFNLYLYGLFLVVYFLFRVWTDPEAGQKKFFRITFKLAGLSVIGILMSAFFASAVVQMILESPRVGGSSSYFGKLQSTPVFWLESSAYYKTLASRIFANDLQGNGSNFTGWRNYLEAPLLYIGILPLLLMPQYFRVAGRRNKLAGAVLVLVFLVPLIFPFFRYSIWLFSGDYFRGFSFFAALVVLLAALYAWTQIERSGKINLYLLAATSLVLLVIVNTAVKGAAGVPGEGARKSVTFFILFYSIILGFYPFTKEKRLLLLLLLTGVTAELLYVNYSTVNDREVLTRSDARQRTGYNDYSLEALSFIKAREREPFYRIDKDYLSSPASYHQSLNSAKVQGYYGTTSYHSFNQKYYIRFLEEMDIILKGNEIQSRWAYGLMNRPVLLSFASVKYHLSETGKPVDVYKALGFDSIATFGNVRVFENRHFLPLGFTYDTYIPLEEFRRFSANQKQLTILHAFVAEEPLPAMAGLHRFQAADTALPYSFPDYFRDLDKRKSDTLSISSFSQTRITGSIGLDSAKLLFLSIPHDKGWHALVDGKEETPVLCNLGFMGLPLEPGTHSVELYYRIPWFYPAMIASLSGLILYLAVLAVAVWTGRRKKIQIT